MKKNIVFKSGSLKMGGLERILIEALQLIDKEKYNITLIIDNNYGKENIFEKDIPKEIKYYFLKSEELINKMEMCKAKKNNIFYKLMHNFYINFETFITHKNLDKILKKIGKIDGIIDFDASATKYIDKIKADQKIVWIHSSIVEQKKKLSKIQRFGKRLEKYDNIIAICDEMKEELEKIYPFLQGKIKRIYNPINFNRIKVLAEDKSELSKKQQDLMNEEYCVAVARLDLVQKDFFTLIDGYELAKNMGLKTKLYILGEGSGRTEIEKYIEKKNLKNEVILIGMVKNPYIWIKNSKLFVHSSRYEGLPTVLIEALICNKMVISSDCPTGPKEILKNETCGKLFKVGDSKQLSEYLLKYLCNKNERKDYLENIKERIEEFDGKNIIKEYEKLIDKI